MDTHLKEAVSGTAELATGKYRVKLIAADAWGSSGYYTSEVLERDGARVFHQGLHMNQNHLTESERWDRPEGSVENLVGTLAADAEFDAAGPEGPGLYADAQFYPSYVSRIAEIKKDVGLSIDAHGVTEEGEKDGRFGPIVVALLEAKSVDVVTKPGAGGKVLHMIESDRGLAGRPIESKEKSGMTDVTKEDFDGLVAKFDALPGLFVDALKGAGLVQAAPEANTETETVVENKGEETTTAVTEPVVEDVVLDYGKVAGDVVSAGLPGLSVAPVIEAMRKGATFEDAIAEQTALREAYIQSSAEQGSVHLQESDNSKPSGLARSVAVLNKK